VGPRADARLRDELLKAEIFYALQEAKNLIEVWRRHSNAILPHSSLGYRPPAPEVLMWPAPPAALNGALPGTSKPTNRPAINDIENGSQKGACWN